MNSLDFSILDDEPIIYLPLFEDSGTNARDIAKNHDGTYSASSPTRPISAGGSFSFVSNGTDYITIPHDEEFNFNSGYSIELWLRDISWLNAEDALITKGDNSWRLQRHNSENKIAFIRETDAGENTVVSADVINAFDTYHVVCVFDEEDQEMHIYFQAELNNSIFAPSGSTGDTVTGNVTGDAIENESDVMILNNADELGRIPDADAGNVAIYDYPLTLSQIRAHYRAGTRLHDYPEVLFHDEPMSYHRAEGDAEDEIYGVSGTNDEVISFSDNQALLLHDTEQSFEFNGTDTYVNLSHIQPDLDDDAISIECWFNTTQTGDIARLVWLGATSTTAGSSLFINASGEPVFQVSDGSDATAGGAVYSDGIWHHVIGTYSRTLDLMKLYVDGVLAAQTSPGFTGSIIGTDPFYLGQSDSGQRYQGLLDEVAIYNYALTQDEAEQHYEIGWRGRYGFSYGIDSVTLGTDEVDATDYAWQIVRG